MTPDELRALADALEPMARAPRFKDMNVPAFCKWLRAQAEAQPVAWRCEVRGDGTDPKLGAVGWRHYSTTTSEREAQAFVARCGDGIEGRAVPLYPHTAPAVPAGYKLVPVEPTQEMLASTSWPGCAGTDYAHMLAAAPAAPQAEPKRAVTCLWSRADEDTDTWETACRHAFTIIEGTPTDNSMAFCCYCGRPLEQEIGGSDAE